jgi:hypothetical protein
MAKHDKQIPQHAEKSDPENPSGDADASAEQRAASSPASPTLRTRSTEGLTIGGTKKKPPG